jgi:outer membrane protein, multidrug efflux system
MNKTKVAINVTSLLLASVLCATLASCKVGPNYARPPVETPTTFKSATTQEAPQPKLGRDWWKLFNDPKLNDLETVAIQENQDVKAAMARVLEARAIARVTKSQFYPQITLDPSATRARASGNAHSPGGHGTTATNIQIPFDLSYEVDIWGRIQRAYESGMAQVQASADDLEVVLQTAEADVAQDYFTIRSLDAQEKILTDTVETFQKQVSLAQTQFHAGLVSQTDVLQAQTQLQNTITLEQEARRQRADTEHALAILLGKPPAIVAVENHPMDLTPPVIPAGLPAELLRRRPDVAEAEQNLIAANAQIGVAKAGFYPTVRLTGAAGFESFDVQHTLDWESRIWSLTPSISFPIFEGGQLEANLALTKARYEELRANYHTAVLGAFRDVEDSLTDLHLRAEEAKTTDAAVNYAAEYHRLSIIQYQKGLVTYLQVIDADRTLLSTQLLSEQLLNQRLISTVLLFKALGGGWDSQAPSAIEPPVHAIQ